MPTEFGISGAQSCKIQSNRFFRRRLELFFGTVEKREAEERKPIPLHYFGGNRFGKRFELFAPFFRAAESLREGNGGNFLGAAEAFSFGKKYNLFLMPCFGSLTTGNCTGVWKPFFGFG